MAAVTRALLWLRTASAAVLTAGAGCAMQVYERMFANNDPAKGGSFYLQSKIYRARECLLELMDEEEERIEREAEEEHERMRQRKE